LYALPASGRVPEESQPQRAQSSHKEHKGTGERTTFRVRDISYGLEGKMAKVSGRKNSRGRSTPINNSEGAMKRTHSDDKPRSRRPGAAPGRTEAEKIERRPRVKANRNNVQPIGKAKKPRKKAA
jgi:hypothetical protein